MRPVAHVVSFVKYESCGTIKIENGVLAVIEKVHTTDEFIATARMTKESGIFAGVASSTR